MSEELGIAVIGCGYWGGNYVRTFSELPDTRVVAACDQRPEALEKLSKRFPRVKLTTDISEVLQMDGLDAIVVCTHASSHYDIAVQCLNAGKHVLLEKPMTVEANESVSLIEIADQANLTLMVGHVYLYNGGIRKVKSYIEQGKAGQLYYLYSQRTNLGPIRHDVNALWDLAPHDISIFNYWLDSFPDWVSAVGHKALRNSREDVGFVVLGYPNNVIGQIHVSWVDPDKVREVVVVGSEMRILFDDMNPQEPVRIFEKGVTAGGDGFPSDRFSMRNGDIISPNVQMGEPLKEQAIHFIESIYNGKKPLTDGRNGLEVVRIMNAIEQSIALNGAPVSLSSEYLKDNKNGHYQEAASSLLR